MVLACGRAVRDEGNAPVHTVPARPGKDDVDELLTDVDRVVVFGDDADLAAVVLRLLRTERLDIAVGHVTAESALAKALTGPVRAVPLVRDAVGGVLVGLGSIAPVRGMAYCDDTRVLNGDAKAIRVTPCPEGVEVTVARRLHRPTTVRGRAFEIGCDPATVISDGVPHEREMKRWHWYRHTEDLLRI
ncbi:MAG TPA: hypothetical protein VFX16_02440 [Pseudonocardiaceae bacterium]|nr:hypothetical protein [Pseudonocardiaceae bacterium]